MAEQVDNETPVQEPQPEAPAPTTIQGKEVLTEDGRKLILRELDPGDMLDLIEAAGSTAASGAWINYATMICSVASIDGIPVPMPNTKVQIKNLAKKIGNTGIVQLNQAIYGTGIPKEAANSELETAKNSPGTP